MKARLEHRRTEVWADGTMIEVVVWRLPAPDADRPHGFKYRLYAGRNGRCLVRYDNERGKSDHSTMVIWNSLTNLFRWRSYWPILRRIYAT